MYENIDKAIEMLAGKITNAIREDQAMKYTQSALNLAHAKATLMSTEFEFQQALRRLHERPKTPEPKGAGA